MNFFKNVSETYSIDLSDTVTLFEASASKILTLNFKADVLVTVNDDFNVSINYFNKQNFIDKEIELSELDRKLIEKIKVEYRKNIERYCAKLLYSENIKYRNCIVNGEIYKVDSENKKVFVEIIEEGFQNNTRGYMPLEYQTNMERPYYREGIKLPFYVVFPPDKETGLLRLSRNHIDLGTKLLFSFIKKEERKNYKIKCIKRIAGAYGLYNSNKFIDKEIIKKVGSMLKERVLVKFLGHKHDKKKNKG